LTSPTPTSAPPGCRPRSWPSYAGRPRSGGFRSAAANFDEEVFDHPERFDIGRSPNPHLGFGGLGTHYCLGANLAKLEIELIFNAVADAMPDIRLRSGWINGIKHLPVSYRATPTVA
jgi:Cytochrome P450